MQPRFITVENPAVIGNKPGLHCALQCSHGSSPWRTHCHERQTVLQLHASMQPRFITVENLRLRSSTPRPSSRFNAATVHPRGEPRTRRQEPHPPQDASMQPRFITVENLGEEKFWLSAKAMLQCSHGSSPWRTTHSLLVVASQL